MQSDTHDGSESNGGHRQLQGRSDEGETLRAHEGEERAEPFAEEEHARDRVLVEREPLFEHAREGMVPAE